jgi:uroporphyrinogen decarboxylase
MPKDTMTGRERWLAVLERRTPDRVPMDYWGTEEATANLCRHLGCDFEEVCRRLHIDVPLTVSGRYIGPPIPEHTNVFGIRHKCVQYGSGVYWEAENAPLAAFSNVEEIEANYIWPSPDWWDYAHLSEAIRGNEDRIIRGGGSEPMLVYKCLRGEEQAFMDLLINPEIVQYALGKLFDLAYQDTLRIFESIPGAVSITYVAEDLGGQEGLMYSPDQIHSFLFPGMKRMMDLTRQNGSHVFTHTDGAVRAIIPDLITLGMEVLNPIQWPCTGMEREGLKRDFGDKIIFHGAVDNQHVLPFGNIREVQEEVIVNLRTLGAGGGYILAPCHNIQPLTPPENIVALYETGYEHGWQ